MVRLIKFIKEKIFKEEEDKKQLTCKELGEIFFHCVNEHVKTTIESGIFSEHSKKKRDALEMELFILGDYVVFSVTDSEKLFGNNCKKIQDVYINCFKNLLTSQRSLSSYCSMLDNRQEEYDKILSTDDDKRLLKLGSAVLEHVNIYCSINDEFLIMYYYTALCEGIRYVIEQYEIIDLDNS